MPNTMWTPAIRYTQDADELQRIAAWLIGQTDSVEGWRLHNDASAIALDYYRLADRLAALSKQAQEFAGTMGQPIP